MPATVTGRFVTADGSAVANGVATVELLQGQSQGTALIIRESKTVTANGSGNFSFSADIGKYRMRFSGVAKSVYFRVTADSGSFVLSDLLIDSED